MRIEVRTEITATVWELRTAVGESVTTGDELLILESMKMEIPLVAPRAGKVSEIRVKREDAVREGDVVVVLEDV